jgi:hypothetical protein
MPTDAIDYDELRRSLMASTVDLTARLTQLLNTPGISETVRKQAERELKRQGPYTKRMERLLGLSSTPPFLPLVRPGST